MTDQQDTLSKSYTDSISSELYRRMEQDDQDNSPSHRRQSNYSIHSNLSNLNNYTTPNKKSRSLMGIDDNSGRRRGSIASGTSSSYYDPIREEEVLYSENDDDNEDDGKVTPLPKVQMTVISILLFSEPLTSTILFPFIYFMASIYIVYWR